MKTRDVKKIIVAMSGGVDSSVTALLLKQQGYPVEGLFMKNWEEDDTEEYCAAAEDLKDAQAVCHTLDIPLHTVNFAAEYWDQVFEHFLAEYRAYRTPNPDILCNKEIKFKAFLDYTQHLGASHIATGHYARVGFANDEYQLLRGLDNNKDQTYFLYTLNQAQLTPTFFPVGELEKPKVRAIAEKAGLVTSKKKDSTGICFIGERRFKNFLSQYIPAQPGPIQTEQGHLLGEHHGLMYYTLGQRQGLGIGGQKHAQEAPWYVAAKNIEDNTLIVVQGHDHPRLYHRHLTANQCHWVSDQPPPQSFVCTAKTRYRQQDEPCQVTCVDDSTLKVTFVKPQWAMTPGQSVVFYDQHRCLGGAIINEIH